MELRWQAMAWLMDVRAAHITSRTVGNTVCLLSFGHALTAAGSAATCIVIIMTAPPGPACALPAPCACSRGRHAPGGSLSQRAGRRREFRRHL